MAHAYFVEGDREEGIKNVLAFVENELALKTEANPDVMVFRHGLLSVDDARRLRSIADLSPTSGDQKVLVITASRLFHEAQNALLKLFEEPPVGTVLFLILPSEGMLLSTLRSRLATLPLEPAKSTESPLVKEFLKASKTEREKIITKLLDRTKSDKDDEKQAARLEAIQLVEGLTRVAHKTWEKESDVKKQHTLELLLDDLSIFLPIMHERSAPLKLIFEHILITLPPLANT